MSAEARIQAVRDCYGAYDPAIAALSRRVLAQDFVFSAPPDVGIDRATYFERCWPNSETHAAFAYERLFEARGRGLRDLRGDQDRRERFRNTEIFGFEGDLISRVEVYFGWDLD